MGRDGGGGSRLSLAHICGFHMWCIATIIYSWLVKAAGTGEQRERGGGVIQRQTWRDRDENETKNVKWKTKNVFKHSIMSITYFHEKAIEYVLEKCIVLLSISMEINENNLERESQRDTEKETERELKWDRDRDRESKQNWDRKRYRHIYNSDISYSKSMWGETATRPSECPLISPASHFQGLSMLCPLYQPHSDIYTP